MLLVCWLPDIFLHIDNCTGQNKNNCMVQYLAWRVMTKRHTNITLSFLPVGHTKFSPDWCFGLFKRQYRRKKVGSPQNIAEVVNTSAECNVAQLVSCEDGTTIVPTLDWTDFFATRFRKVQGRCITSASCRLLLDMCSSRRGVILLSEILTCSKSRGHRMQIPSQT